MDDINLLTVLHAVLHDRGPTLDHVALRACLERGWVARRPYVDPNILPLAPGLWQLTDAGVGVYRAWTP